MASLAPADNTNQLQITDLAEVLQLLKRLHYPGTTYYELGLSFGLSPATLDIITKNNRDDVEGCLRQCLTKWLQKADKVQEKGGPTVYSLVSALRELGENGVADEIDHLEKHPACKIFAPYTSNQSLVALLPQFTALLCLEKLIKEMLLATNVQGDTLLIQIKKAICIDYQKLQAFAEILCKFKVTAEMGNAIMKKCRHAYCIDDLIKVTDNTNAEGLKIFLPKNVTSKFKLMRLSLGQTFFKVGSIMINNPQSPTLDNIKAVLRIYDKALRPQVAQCQDIREVLELVCDNCQLDDISMLEYFVDEFNIEEAKVVIEEYKKAVDELKEMKLSQCLNETVSYRSPLECERITIFVDKDTNESVFNDVQRILSALFKNSSRHIKLNVIRDSDSFTITCSFPLILSEQLIRAALNNIDVLKENKVKRLTIGYCTVYEVNDTSTPTKCGLMKQLMLSLSVQLINSTEEITILNEENIAVKTEAKSCKELLNTKIKMLNASLSENQKLKTKATETNHLLQEKVLHLTEHEEENKKMEEIKELLEEQLVLFQSEKEEFIQERSLLETIEIQKRDEEIQQLKIQLASYQEQKESEEESFAEEIKKLQSATDKDEMRDKIVQGLLSQNGKLKGKLSVAEKMTEQLQKELKQEQTESKKEIELLQEKITTMNLQQIERDKEVQEKEETLMLKIENLMRSKDNLIFEDDIYGDIIIENPLILKIIKTHQFQRLKDIKKLGYIYQNISKSTYSRLEHSIGMYYLAGEYVKQLQRRQPELNITESDVLCVQIAALCFNLGHGPFSHIFEMFLKEVFPSGNKPWEKVSEASVMMFDHMIKENAEVKNLLKKFLDNYKEDIEFIKELIHGARTGQRKGKEFLYEIVVNKTSGLDVCMIDYTTRDAAVLGMNIKFKWRVFFSKVEVRHDNGERHIFFQKDDLETYNDLFRTRHSLFRKLYYLHKNRIVAVMIKRILVKSNRKPIIRDGDSHVTISEATKSMFAYTQLNDSILSVIKSQVDDPEVQILLDCHGLDTMKFIGQIGYVIPKDNWDKEKIKNHIIKYTKSCDITDQLEIDPIKNGYENCGPYTQYYYTSNNKIGQWTEEWAQPPPFATEAPVRIFLVSGDMNLIHEVQEVLQNLIQSEPLIGEIYPDEENCDLMPHLPAKKLEQIL